MSGEKATAGIDRESGRVVTNVAQGTKGFGGMAATSTDLCVALGRPIPYAH